MAGFDAMFRFHADDHDLIVALMTAARRRARALGVRWQSSVSADGRGYCRMDGNGFRLDMLLERMRRDLPTIAEATPADRHTPAERRRLANGLIDVLCRSRVSYYDRYDKEASPIMCPACGASGRRKWCRCELYGRATSIPISTPGSL